MRKLVRSLVAGLLIGFTGLAVLGVAQTINQSVQLSQDPRGPYGVDTTGNLYIFSNLHLLTQINNSAGPTVSTSPNPSTGCAMVTNPASTDMSGTLTGCSSSSGTVLFGRAYLSAPRCVATSSNATNVALTVTAVTTGVQISPNTNGAGSWTWICTSAS